jgi:hypothetical protein
METGSGSCRRSFVSWRGYRPCETWMTLFICAPLMPSLLCTLHMPLASRKDGTHWGHGTSMTGGSFQYPQAIAPLLTLHCCTHAAQSRPAFLLLG